MVSSSQPDRFSLLLDQGFPKPTKFAISALDQSVVVEHFSDFAPELAEQSTPDWYVYCIAAEAGYNALVVRDRSQLDQLAEMYVLSRLPTLTVVTWRKGTDDPIREWGQLLAYMPHVKSRALEAGGRALLLPTPTLGKDAFYNPVDTIGVQAKQREVSQGQVRAEARTEIDGWLEIAEEATDRFDDLLGH